jgi:hypothetical protein
MVSFQPQNPYLGKFWRVLDWKMLIYFMAIWNSLQPFGTFYDNLVHFVSIWYILCPFGTFFSCSGNICQEKSGNPRFNRTGYSSSACASDLIRT